MKLTRYAITMVFSRRDRETVTRWCSSPCDARCFGFTLLGYISKGRSPQFVTVEECE